MIMGIQQIGAVITMPSQVKLDHALSWHRVDITDRIEGVVKGVNEDVVNVEQDCAVGFVGAKELPLGQS
jgi:hypothetical protein